MSVQANYKSKGVSRVVNRTNLLTLAIVIALFAVLPLSQNWLTQRDEDMVVVRRVDIAPPPPPPPPPQTSRENPSTEAAAQGGLGLKSLGTMVNLKSLSGDIGQIQAGSLGIGMSEMDLHIKSHATFEMQGIGFGATGLDRPPFVINRPTLSSEFLKKMGIMQFSTVVMVKWRKDGSLLFISIEEIEFPDPELAEMVKDAVSRMVYTKPTINGEPVDRFLRLPLVIYRAD